MDGVIVDSMPYHYLAWYEALYPYGIRATAFDVYEREGESWKKTLTDLFTKEGIAPSKAIFAKIFIERQKIFNKIFKRHIFPHAQDFIKCVKNQGYKLALVTGTPYDEAKRILPKNIFSLFDQIIGGDMVRHGKPHPEPYLKAANKLKTKPSECIVIENAPLGIRSAKSAGMFCIAVTTSLPKQYLQEADITVDHIEDITGFIEKACREPRR